LPLFRRDRLDDPARLFQIGNRLGGLRLVGDRDVRAVLLEELRVEFGRHWPGETRGEVPVLFRYDRFDLALAIADQLQCYRLDAPGAQAAAHLVPQQRTDFVTNEPIQDTARLLRVDHLLVDRRRLFERRQDALLGDFVEHQAADLLPVT